MSEAAPAQELMGVCTPSLECAERGAAARQTPSSRTSSRASRSGAGAGSSAGHLLPAVGAGLGRCS